ncbi:MAG: alkaline phosphatase family protein [Candidatus Eisenbacteria bacterium]|nr:alkaline phosphatase family protein [Candidatus Eisenbacteria bacterium]
MKPPTKPVLLLGLDGAGWPVLEPLLARGAMPFLAGLLGRGCWGPLMSPWPGSTFPSWTSIMTGVTPGHHGVLDFTEFDPATYSVRFTDSRSRRVPAVWERVHRAGLVAAVLGVPGTFPPDSSVDLMISGFDTPVTTSIEPSFIHPPDWRKRLLGVGGFPLTPVQELRISPGWHRRACPALQQSIEGKVRVAEFVLRELRPDLFVMVFGESDTACHHFWPFADARSPRRPALTDPEMAGVIGDIYSRLDSALARVTAAAGDVGLVMVVSDHGFGGAGADAICLNRFLERQGFLRFRKGGGRRLGFPSAIGAAGLLPRALQQRLFRRARRLVGALESRRRLGGIGWEGTTAYSEELPYAPAVRINLAGREGRGVVAPDRYDAVLDDVGAALLGWKDARTGDAVVTRVMRREEVTDGPALGGMPDLLLDLAEPEGYSYVVASSMGRNGPDQRRMNLSALGAKGSGMGGTHRREGILVACGEGVRPGRLPAATDAHQVAGALLAALGLPAPPGMGEPPISLPRPTREGEGDSSCQRAAADAVSWEWERLERLKGLGYLG